MRWRRTKNRNTKKQNDAASSPKSEEEEEDCRGTLTLSNEGRACHGGRSATTTIRVHLRRVEFGAPRTCHWRRNYA
eukprot:4675409-Pyramimonas_sp.AAC.1